MELNSLFRSHPRSRPPCCNLASHGVPSPQTWRLSLQGPLALLPQLCTTEPTSPLAVQLFLLPSLTKPLPSICNVTCPPSIFSQPSSTFASYSMPHASPSVLLRVLQRTLKVLVPEMLSFFIFFHFFLSILSASRNPISTSRLLESLDNLPCNLIALNTGVIIFVR